MQELVGTCNVCKRKVYCLNGFLNGVYAEGILYCFKCVLQKNN